MKPQLRAVETFAQAFSKLLHPFAEVVIHDLEHDRIEAIYNPFSRREVGDSSYLDRWDFTVDPQDNVIGPYEKINYDGRHLKCISVVIRDEKEKALGFLCVNMDISVFETYRNTLSIFLANNDTDIPTERQSIFRDDLYERINNFVQKFCREHQVALEALSRNEKQELVAALKTNGAFSGKNAAQYIARILNISRASVYNYVKDIEGDAA